MNKEERLISLCQEAVRIPSMSGQEKQVAELMKHTMTSYGFDEVNIDKYGSVLGLIHGSRTVRGGYGKGFCRNHLRVLHRTRGMF